MAGKASLRLLHTSARARGGLAGRSRGAPVTSETIPEVNLPDPFNHLQQALSDRYRIERELGQGGMARVYLAIDLRRQRTVALKVLRPELAVLIGTGRFLREIEIAGKLSHPNIVPLFDAGDADGLPYFVMPFVEGESLRDRLRLEGQLSIEEALRITREVADALSYAHALGFIHRDIKPENILLSRGHALVSDFGIARAVAASEGSNRLTETGMAIGTVDYMSPEQAAGSQQVDARSDLYSLACVLYEMLAGGPPFRGSTAQAVIARHLVDPVPPIRTVRGTVPESVEAATLAALAKSKADRFATVQEFIEALEGRRVSPPLPFPAAVPPRSRQRSRALLFGILAAALLAAGAGYLALRPPAFDDRRVLVAPFEDRTGDSSLGALADQAAGEIVNGLASIGVVQPVDARSVASDSGRDLPTLRRLARRVGASSVVSGAIVRRGDAIEIQVRLTDTRTGAPLRPVRPVVAPAGQPSAVATALAQRVMAAYAAHFDPRFRRYATISQPTGYEAYRELQSGITVRRGEAEGAVDSAQLATAVAHFRRAIALEPDFMAPRIQVASIYALIGECRLADSVAASIRATGARLLTTDQATIDHLMAGCHQDPRGRYVAAQQLFRDAPEMAENVFALAQAALMYNKPSESLSCMERLERTHDPEKFRFWCWNIMTHAHHQLGQYREALRLTERIRATDPDHWFIDRYELRQWAALGDTARVNQQIERSLARRDQAVEAGDDMLWIGEELRGHGHRAAGRALCARGVAWFAARPSSQRASDEAKSSVAKLLYCAEQWDEARAAYALLAATDSSGSDAIRVRTRLGAIAARRGDSVELTRIDQWLAARDSLPLASYGRAVLAAFLGDQARAFTLFQFAWERNHPNFIEAHVDPALEPLRDYPPLRALLEAAR